MVKMTMMIMMLSHQRIYIYLELSVCLSVHMLRKISQTGNYPTILTRPADQGLVFKIVRSSYLRLVPQINHGGGGEDHDNEDDAYHQHCNYLGVMGSINDLTKNLLL